MILPLLLCLSFLSFTVIAQEAEAVSDVVESNQVTEEGITPTFIVFPALNLFTSVESVGRTNTGTMDVPNNWQNVAWYEPGFAPGEDGHAALSAHLDWSGNTGPFWGLADVPNGSLLAVVGESGRILVYMTVSNQSYDRVARVSDQVFGPANESRLSLITCEGTFEESLGTYDKRQVLEAVLIFDTADGQLRN